MMHHRLMRLLPQGVKIKQTRSVSNFIVKYEKAVDELPHREAVRYKDKNIKWSAQEFNKFVDEHARALIDLGFPVGTVVVNWMEDCKEKHLTFMAYAKVGFKIIEIDPSVQSIQEIRECLSFANCRMIVIDTETADFDRLALLRKAIPEFYFFDDAHGQAFHSKHFPNLKQFIHTGFQTEIGCSNLNQWCVGEGGHLDKLLEIRKDQTNDAMILYQKIAKGPNGQLTATPEYSYSDVVEKKIWTFADNIINQKYFEF